MGEFIARHPEYLDLIDEVHPGSGAYPRLEPAGSNSHHDEDLAGLERDLA
ncbi:hypothetical protein [Pseudonocardia humida]|uniref:Uncharacterized protein n=1 Tax=Pseudonocardia humida TaxID=2800819 RepID=A0ABT1ACC1_9PSEU|nr:hypothetical protein [Pseudonocardia humida]MCO1660546.1 hypothetical protein [Pseudonocardia humida]